MNLKNVSRPQWAGAWLATIAVMFVFSAIAGGSTSTNARTLWLFACLAPPAVMLLVWRPPSSTVAEVLYAARNPERDGRA